MTERKHVYESSSMKLYTFFKCFVVAIQLRKRELSMSIYSQ